MSTTFSLLARHKYKTLDILVFIIMGYNTMMIKWFSYLLMNVRFLLLRQSSFQKCVVVLIFMLPTTSSLMERRHLLSEHICGDIEISPSDPLLGVIVAGVKVLVETAAERFPQNYKTIFEIPSYFQGSSGCIPTEMVMVNTYQCARCLVTLAKDLLITLCPYRRNAWAIADVCYLQYSVDRDSNIDFCPTPSQI